MTFNEAIQFFADYGSVSHDIIRLKAERPKLAQLDKAVEFAVAKGQPKEVAEEAKTVVMRVMRIPNYAPKQTDQF